MKQAQVYLKAFLTGSANPFHSMPGCANYDHHHGGCLFDDDYDGKCCVLDLGQRCNYFERSVLATSSEIGQRDRIYDLYAQQAGDPSVLQAIVNAEPDRTCPDCGTGLPARRRYCEPCARKRHRENRRRWSRTRKLTK